VFSLYGKGWKYLSLVTLLSLLLGFRFVFLPAEPKGLINLRVGEALLKVRVAEAPLELERGLSGVPLLRKNEGMIFVLPQKKAVQFHMKGVGFPLSIAFIDRQGVILGIKEMNPREPNQFHPAPRKARYALEVRQGWFERNRVKAGDLVRPQSRTLSQPTKGIGKDTEGT